jgi:hypothetical protein
MGGLTSTAGIGTKGDATAVKPWPPNTINTSMIKGSAKVGNEKTTPEYFQRFTIRSSGLEAISLC